MQIENLALKEIKLIVYDFDGVMTDNRVIVDQSGKESVVVNRADGLAVSRIKEMGIEQIILSTEKDPVVQKRAEKLDIFCINGLGNKKTALEDYLRKVKVDKKNVVYIGNDINDLEVMEYIGYPVAPADAHPQIKKIAKIVTKAKGGDGVIREFLDILYKNQGG